MMLARLRRASQVVFLTLFLFLLVQTEFRGSFRIPWPVSLFLQLDPLVALVNALSTGALYKGLLWSLAVIIPTIFLGRFFCGWVCPLGTLHHWLSGIRSEKRRGLVRIESNRYQRWQAVKYYLLFAVLALAVFGSGIAGWLDPTALLVRSLALSVLPALNFAANSVIDSLAASDWLGFRYLSVAIHFLLKDTLLSFRQPYFHQAVLLGLIFFAFLALNLRITRFWCRAVCPLGALLGIASRWAIFGLEKRPSRCEDCNRCLLNCQGGDDPIPGVPWRKAECHLCMNCVADCPESGLEFRFFPARQLTRDTPDLRRRAAVASLLGGTATLPLLRAAPGLAVGHDERRIRPPGALDEKNFLARCVRCGQCMKVCPNNALHASFSEAGLEGLWTPVVVPRIGYCEPNCVLCGQVCPTGAIWEFTTRQKAWVGATGSTEPIRIGTAFFDRGRCLPWAMGTECIVCEEWCPTTPKAILLRPGEGNERLRQPWLDPRRCVGCGACEYACPVKDRPAVYVTSAGESRSRTNQFLLQRAGPGTEALMLEAPGWSRTSDIRVFPADKLHQYIDGDAERYLKAGIERTLTAKFRHQSGVEAVVDIHLMNSPEAARRIHESEPATGSRPASIGDAARHYGVSITCRKGRAFVRLTAYQDTPGTAGALETLARAALATAIQTVTPGGQKPGTVSQFPKAGNR